MEHVDPSDFGFLLVYQLVSLPTYLLLLYCSYNGAITKCVTAIIVLQRKCKEYQQEGDQGQTSSGSQQTPVMGPPAKVRAIRGPGTRDSSRSSSNETEQEVGFFVVNLSISNIQMQGRWLL